MTEDDDLNEALKDTAEAGRGVSRDHAARFYDRIRVRIGNYLDNKGGMVEKTAGFLLLVPDMFILLWRLANDRRVSGKNKVLLGSGLAYFIFPFDLIPEALIGPLGYLDDLVFAVYVLNKMLTDTDVEILREHWSGKDDVLDAVRRVLAAADQLVGSKVVAAIKKMVK
ncbi:MAG: YkvA family protein [Thermoanaerobaculia bacterium]